MQALASDSAVMFFAGAPPHLTAAAVALLCRDGAIREIARMNAFPAGFRIYAASTKNGSNSCSPSCVM
jgi:hypothetical protein